MTAHEKTSPYALLTLTTLCLIILIFSISQIINLVDKNNKLIEINKTLAIQSHEIQKITAEPNQNYETVIHTLNARFPNEPDIATKFGITQDIANLPLNEQITTINQRVQENTQNQKEYPKPLLSRAWFWLSSILGWVALTILGRVITQVTDRIYIQRIEPWFDKHCSFKKNLTNRH
ncbi:MAG: hypothetical protein SFW07_03990 [Gammaproteobacteria bacterium]|nr:hypothetical protein [Gammaproteobacteria bacterium]